jgi:hypothetical protein
MLQTLPNAAVARKSRRRQPLLQPCLAALNGVQCIQISICII